MHRTAIYTATKTFFLTPFEIPYWTYIQEKFVRQIIYIYYRNVNSYDQRVDGQQEIGKLQFTYWSLLQLNTDQNRMSRNNK